MSRWICLDCKNTFTMETNIKQVTVDKHKYGYCPIHNCGGMDVFECDENMVAIIMTLNEIGLKTAFSCGGHIGSDETDIYIAFDSDIESYMLGKLPHGFELEEKDMIFDRVVIRHTIKDSSVPIDLVYQQYRINKAINDLIQWTQNKIITFDAFGGGE